MVDKVEIQEEETGIEKPEEQTNETQSAQSKPEGLPEKFNSVEDLAKSYAELEKKLGGQSQETKEEVDPVAKAQPKTSSIEKIYKYLIVVVIIALIFLGDQLIVNFLGYGKG